MSLIEEALWSKVTTNAGVSALISARLYPESIPQVGGAYDCIVYTTEGGQHLRFAAGISKLAHAEFEFECWSITSYAAAAALRDALRKALDGFTGTVLSVSIRAVFLERRSDVLEASPGLDQRRAFAALEAATVWYSEVTS